MSGDRKVDHRYHCFHRIISLGRFVFTVHDASPDSDLWARLRCLKVLGRPIRFPFQAN